MNNTGLRQPDLDIVLSILDEFPNVKEAIIFGSRAKGNFRNGSDVDIALKGENINLETVSTFSYKLKVILFYYHKLWLYILRTKEKRQCCNPIS